MAALEDKISVVIPTYNHSRWLPESVESALRQTLKPLEVIVVDDGSKDDTRQVVSKYPVTYVYQQNAGLSAARNKGIDTAKGK
jgi:glycosyltransferase involved in cell wall biosynthesis